ncbi:hypothetical protein [Kitasatospora sp. NPDC015120]|uniref:hypothetical protein n=1 Tax=Kitasatospora sp. NPDC015120 TaxID=3364023 RepID=UPI0036F49C2B
MTPVLQFLTEALTDPAGPQADYLAALARNLGLTATGAANTVLAVRALRDRGTRKGGPRRGSDPVPPKADAE